MLLAGVVVVLAAVAWWFYRAEAAAQEALRLQEEAAAQVFDAAQAKLEEAEASSYDIDQTIRVIHSIDVALQEHEDFEGYLRTMARQDYRDVAPEVLASRRELLEVLQPLYAKQVELEDQQAMWEMTSELLLATLSVVSVAGDMDLVAPSGSFGVDREQAQVLWEDLKQRRADRQKLQRDLAELDEQLVDALVDYAGVYYRYVEEWDALSLLRDRAYLAAHNGDWSAAASAARLAVEQAPKEREAHLLLAMALIEGGKLEQEAEVRALLEETMQQHPDQSAPALLLLGVLEAKLGRGEEARLAFQQAAAYYPKQSDALLDMLDPYQMRSFLSESRRWHVEPWSGFV